MDSVTQGLLGALTSQAVSGKKFPYYAILIGIIAGTIGDLDIFIRTSNPLSMIIYHRQFTHALIAIPIGGLLIAGIFLLFVKSMRPYWGRVILAAMLAYASHIFLDVLTSFGTQIYWPWSNARVTLNALPIVDPIMTVGLFLGLLFSLQKITTWRPFLPILLVLGYIGFSAYQHHRATIAMQTRMPAGAKALQVMPTIGQVYVWNAVYRLNGQIYFSVIHVPYLSDVFVHQAVNFPLYTESMLPAWVKNNPSMLAGFRTFDWFCDGYLTMISRKPLLIANARYVLDLKPLTFLWGIRYTHDNKQPKLEWVRRLSITEPRTKRSET